MRVYLWRFRPHLVRGTAVSTRDRASDFNRQLLKRLAVGIKREKRSHTHHVFYAGVVAAGLADPARAAPRIRGRVVLPRMRKVHVHRVRRLPVQPERRWRQQEPE